MQNCSAHHEPVYFPYKRHLFVSKVCIPTISFLLFDYTASHHLSIHPSIHTNHRIPGAGWSYFGADPDWGEKQAANLKIALEAALANHDVKVVSQIQGSIELAPRELHKGVMVRRLFEKVLAVRAGKLPAFTIIVGDEPSDDAMVTEFVDTLAKAAPSAGVSELKSFMITVGKRKCPSPLYLNDVKEVEQILAEFAAVSLSS